MFIALIRHGEKLSGSRFDNHLVPITDKGVAQANVAADTVQQFILDKDIPLEKTKFVSSKFLRTKQMMWATLGIFKDIDNESLKWLNEKDYHHVGLVKDNPDIWDKYKKAYNISPFHARLLDLRNTEDVNATIRRNLIRYIRKQEAQNIEFLVIFGHSGVNRLARKQLLDINIDLSHRQTDAEYYNNSTKPAEGSIEILQGSTKDGFNLTQFNKTITLM